MKTIHLFTVGLLLVCLGVWFPQPVIPYDDPDEAGEIPDSRKEAIREIKRFLENRYRTDLGRAQASIETIIDVNDAVNGVIDKVKLAKAVYDYAQVVQKIENDMKNTVRLIESIPDLEQRKTMRVYFALANDGHLMNIDQIRQIVFGGADISIQLALAAGGLFTKNIEAAKSAAEFGISLMNAGSILDLKTIQKSVDSRVVRDVFGDLITLGPEEVKQLQAAPGKSLQEKYDNTAVLFNDQELWLDQQWRDRLLQYAKAKGLPNTLTWEQLYEHFQTGACSTYTAATGATTPAPDYAASVRDYLQDLMVNSPQVHDCVKAERESVASALYELNRVGTPNAPSKFKPYEEGAGWQLTPSEPIVKEYERMKAAGSKDAWNYLQRSGWKELLKERMKILETTINECQNNHHHR